MSSRALPTDAFRFHPHHPLTARAPPPLTYTPHTHTHSLSPPLHPLSTRHLSSSLRFAAADWTQQFTAQLSSLLLAAGAFVDRSSGMHPSNVVNGVLQGVAGLALCPLRGLHDRGIVGLIIGFFVGGVGLVVKPLTGILATASDASALLRSTFDPTVTVKKHALRRQRPPRIFRSSATTPSFSSALKVYRAEESAGEELLSRVWRGRFFSDRYIRHEEVGDPIEGEREGDVPLAPFLLVLTDVRLCCLRNDYARYCELVWSIRIRDVASVTHLTSPPIVELSAATESGLAEPGSAAMVADDSGSHDGRRVTVDVHHFPELVKCRAPRSHQSNDRAEDGEKEIRGGGGFAVGIALCVQRLECSAQFGASLNACFSRSTKERAGAVNSYKTF